MKYLIMAGAVLLLIGSGIAIREYWRHADIQTGIDKQKAAEISIANQNLATRRKTDAKFNKMDARAFCIAAGLEWVFEDDRSFCR